MSDSLRGAPGSVIPAASYVPPAHTSPGVVQRRKTPSTAKRAAKRAPSKNDAGVYVARSAIHGRGIFAARAFRKGALIARFEGEPTKRNSRHVLWVPTDDGGWEGRRGTNALRWINHSPKPNAIFEGWELRALKAIPRDEEVTVHYGEDAP